MGSYFKDNYANTKIVKERKPYPGLRNAQVGAIHAIASHFTVHAKTAALVVMPTGSGKTGVLMMAPYLLECHRVLIVTPSVMVRGQIAEDYSTLSTLKKATVFNDSVSHPRVYELLHKYEDKYKNHLLHADVVIATPSCALSLSEDVDAKDFFDIVIVDEAHHTPAKTWTQILKNMADAKHLLFTATPFRLDKKEIKGQLVFSYPLSLAYRDGIYGEIEYIPVEEGPNKDRVIAKQAETVLFNDRKRGYNHFIMIRTHSKSSAKELEDIYSSETTLRLKRIDSSMHSKKVETAVQELKDQQLDGIICVDMLGEGFDFPNLKIAAVHSPHKSLASTLQFIGRFARTNADDIGTAKFIAMNDEELRIENKVLFSKDAIWQDIIINLSESRIEKEVEDKEFFSRFVGKTSETEEIPIPYIRPNCHAKVYRVEGFNINSGFPQICHIDDNSILINEDDQTVIGVGRELSPPRWLVNDAIVDVENYLYIVHFQKKTAMLFIYSPIKTESLYEKIAESFCEKFEKVPRYQMNRVLGKLEDFEIFNSGMQSRYIESGESYRITAGSDVSSAVDATTGQLFSPGHVFCKAIEDESAITIGFSSGSKMWSSAYLEIPEYIRWCDHNGTKINNPNLKVKTNTNFDLLSMPQPFKEYPLTILFADFHHGTYSTPPIVEYVGGKSTLLTDFQVSVNKIAPKYVQMNIHFDGLSCLVQCDTNGTYSRISEKDLVLSFGRQTLSLVDYLNDYPLVLKTSEDSVIIGSEIHQGDPSQILFDPQLIIDVDWEKLGTDIYSEVDDTVGKKSIQTVLEELLLEDAKNSMIIKDHGTGEIADLIAVVEEDLTIEVSLFHVKRMTAAKYNGRIEDVIEVTSQAVKSTIWIKNKAGFRTKVHDRQKSGHCAFKRGTLSAFDKMLRKNKQLVGHVIVVQPGISNSVTMPDKVQSILASGNFYIRNTGKVKSFCVWGS